jgi:hypothetical protein
MTYSYIATAPDYDSDWCSGLVDAKDQDTAWTEVQRIIDSRVAQGIAFAPPDEWAITLTEAS